MSLLPHRALPALDRCCGSGDLAGRAERVHGTDADPGSQPGRGS
ncbi:hypothetical protein ACFQ7I_31675 [Streptomyces massasporeus]